MSEVEGLDAAIVVIRDEHRHLLALWNQARRVHGELIARLRQIEREREDANRRVAQLQAEESRSEVWTVAMATLREQQQTLRQQAEGLAERIDEQANVIRRLRVVCQQSQMNLEYLADAVGHEVGERETIDPSQIRVLQAQEEERQRLAREVHDGPAQVLANAIFEIEFCQRLLAKDPGRVMEELERLKGDMRAGLAEVRSFIFDLRTGPLAEFGLVTTLRRYAENYESRFRIAVALQLDDDLARLPATSEIAIFRIVQEALQNARKHSGATQVRVRLGREVATLVAEVHDNGSGFDPHGVEGGPGRHFGLTSMRERARLIRGELTIDSRPDRGTTVILRLPLDQARAEPSEPELIR